MTWRPPPTSNGSVLSEPICFGGETVRLELQLDQVEIDRRLAVGAAELHAPELIELLFEIPEGATVPIAELPPAAAAILHDAPDWAAHTCDTTVVRSYRPAANVQMAFAEDPTSPWETQLDSLRWFAPLCTTMILVSDLVEAFEAADAARGVGVGVGIIEPDGWYPIEQPHRDAIQVTAHRWVLAEHGAAQFMTPATPPPSKP